MSDDKPLSRGWRRVRELKTSAERELEELKTALVGCLGREPSAVDEVAIEALASATMSARKQRARGKSDREDLRLVAQLLRASGLKPAPLTAAADPVNPFGILFNVPAAEEES
jgi:ParB-like chromosome segregation protein Spo0J